MKETVLSTVECWLFKRSETMHPLTWRAVVVSLLILHNTTEVASQFSRGIQTSVNILTITNVEIFVSTGTTAVTVEEMTGGGRMIKKTRGTAVFPQETISVPK